jgi:hypothetical protein
MSCAWQKIDRVDDTWRWVCPRSGFKTNPTKSERITGSCPTCVQVAKPCYGPGDHLHRILLMLGFSPSSGCGCKDRLTKMNTTWGVDGCRERRAEIAQWLRDGAYKNLTVASLRKAAARAVTSGLAFKLSPLDPFGSLVDEAIKRAEQATVVSQAGAPN